MATTTKAKTKAKPKIDIRGWPGAKVELWPINKLLPYADNPRTHSKDQVAYIARLMTEFGWTTPVLVDEDGELIAGHGRVLAAKVNRYDECPVMVASGWTEDQKRAYRIADNQSTLLGEWDTEKLASELRHLVEAGITPDFIGFSEVELLEMDIRLGGMEPDLGEVDASRLLRLIDITIDDPKHVVERGEHWMLSGKHHLFVCSVASEWSRWQGVMAEGVLFCPFAGVFVPFSKKAADHVLVMVQPDPYIAGHMLDRYAEANGEASITLSPQG
jgi:hypothetical protein